MPDILRVYDPAECDERGVPLGWERCRQCEGRGLLRALGEQRSATITDAIVEVPCEFCGGHGSLKAAALAYLCGQQDPAAGLADPVPLRCEGCGHPMSEGTWEPIASLSMTDDDRQFYALGIGVAEDGVGRHYSPCDEGCRHGLPARWAEPDEMFPSADRAIVEEAWDDVPGSDDPHGEDRVADLLNVGPIEASWRQVDVRTLGWPHDLRPEKLAVLCLRCWATRTT